MFKKILIANRGEIAVRIIRACQELGIETVAVYSEVDRNALHVRYADEAYHIGPAPSRESYLRIDKIIDVARKSGADAIHPGYGFLAEKADFCAGLRRRRHRVYRPVARNRSPPWATRRWRAPPWSKMAYRSSPAPRAMPISPMKNCWRWRRSIGFPLLIKASAGGGGKGQREVRDIESMPALLAAARREAESSFSDGRVYLERMVEGARHIEFQLLGDHYGNIIHLGERECSLQRRRQKLVEEAPSVALDDDLRRKMGAMAVKRSPGGQLLQRRHDRMPARQARQLLFHGDEHAHSGRTSRSPSASPASTSSKSRFASRAAANCATPRTTSNKTAGPSSAASTPKTRSRISCQAPAW